MTVRALAAAAMICLSACSAVACSMAQIVNLGGDTRCGDFISQDEKRQFDEVAKMLRDSTGAEAMNLEISATRVAVLAYCTTIATPDNRISEAPHR